MKLSGQLKCPECGESIRGSLDRVQGVSEMFPVNEKDTPGEFEFSGSTEMFWDEQMNLSTEKGRMLVVCHNGHDWLVDVPNGDEPQSLADCAPAVDEPYIWLNEDEEQGAADCGCRLVRDHKGGGPAFFACATHGGA